MRHSRSPRVRGRRFRRCMIMILKTVFVIVIKLKWEKKCKIKQNQLPKPKRKQIKSMVWLCKPPVLWPCDSKWGGVQKSPHRKERMGSGDHSLGPMLVQPPAPVSSQRKSSRLSDTSVQGWPTMGLPSPVPLRTVPDPKRVEASLRHGRGDSGLVAVPGHGGAVPVTDGQRVGLGVEHPVLWR